MTQSEIMIENLAQTYINLEDDLIASVSKHFSVTETVDDAQAWRLDKLKEYGGLRQENIKIVASQTGKTAEKVTEIMKQAGYESLAVDDVVYRQAVENGVLKAIPPGASSAIEKLLTTSTKDTIKTVNLMNTSALQSANKAFTTILDQVYLETSLGVTDYQTSMSRAVRKFADEGITHANYISEAGRATQNHIDVAVRRCVMTASAQTSAEMQLARADQYDVDLVEVDSHAGSRPSHAEWQGKIYSRSGKDKRYGDFVSSTGYGSVSGLAGANCKHRFYPFIEGISERKNYPIDEKENQKAYEETQTQRRLERDIREQKRRIIAADNADDAQGKLNAQLKLKDKEAQAKAFSSKTGRSVKTNRQQVIDFDQSKAMKAYWANVKAG